MKNNINHQIKEEIQGVSIKDFNYIDGILFQNIIHKIKSLIREDLNNYLNLFGRTKENIDKYRNKYFSDGYYNNLFESVKRDWFFLKRKLDKKIIMNEEIPSAEEFLMCCDLPDDTATIQGVISTKDILIEFAQIHAQAALKAAYKNSNLYLNPDKNEWEVDIDSILNAYPLDLIK